MKLIRNQAAGGRWCSPPPSPGRRSRRPPAPRTPRAGRRGARRRDAATAAAAPRPPRQPHAGCRAAALNALPDQTVDKGDTAWMLISSVLVLLMIIPGLALFYGGLVRQKNMLSMLMQVTTV